MINPQNSTFEKSGLKVFHNSPISTEHLYSMNGVKSVCAGVVKIGIYYNKCNIGFMTSDAEN